MGWGRPDTAVPGPYLNAVTYMPIILSCSIDVIVMAVLVMPALVLNAVPLAAW